MRTAIVTLFAVLLITPAFGCAMQQRKAKKGFDTDNPVNCQTAEGDIRALRGEKVWLGEQIVEGVTAVTPAGAVLGIVMGTEVTKLEVAVGEYDRMIDKRIAQIKQTCGV